MGNSADAGPSREQMPHSWEGIGGGHLEAVAHWRRTIEKREKLEEEYPGLAGDRRPVLALEGIFAKKPLRAGDDVQKMTQEALTNLESVDDGAPDAPTVNKKRLATKLFF